MAIVRCPHCKRKISTLVDFCPHCREPIKQQYEKINKEIEYLTNKIKPFELTIPRPRVFVCIKCGNPCYTPICQDCNMPVIEINYPKKQCFNSTSYGATDSFIIHNIIIPYNIGDPSSEQRYGYIEAF